LSRLVLVILAVADVPRALRFYRDAFGWAQAVDVPVYAELALPDGLRLGLYRRDAFASNTGEAPFAPPAGALAPTELYLHVDDVGAAQARLEAAGARRLSDRAPRPWGDEAAYYADPDGNVVVVARPLLPDSQ
jgi:catechol 2,3-dioxygenase-like lactoylglutathione lyase family enzyme